MDVYQDLIEQTKRLYTAPYQVKNFICQEEIDTCLKIYDALPIFEAGSHSGAIRKDFLMYDNTRDTRMKTIFAPKLRNLFPGKQISIDGGNFTQWLRPVMLHTDGYQFRYTNIHHVIQKQSVLGYAVLVPLKTDTGKGCPTTIFFDQKCFGEEANGATIQDLKTRKVIENLTDKEFECVESEPRKFILSRHSPEILYGFNVSQIFSWNPGDAIVWHRAQFHCAGQFLGYTSKTHLIFFVNFIL